MYKMNGGYYYPMITVELIPARDAITDKPTLKLYFDLLGRINYRDKNIDYVELMNHLHISKKELDRELQVLQEMKLLRFDNYKPTLYVITGEEKNRTIIVGKNMDYSIYESVYYDDEDERNNLEEII